MAHKDVKTPNLIGGERAYESLLHACLSLCSERDPKELNSLGKNFSELSSQLHAKVEELQFQISKIPFLAIILFWADLVRKDKIFGERYLLMMQELIEEDLLPCYTDHKKPVLLKDLSLQDSSEIIHHIRSFQQWSVERREDYILLYKMFSSWLTKETLGYIPEAKDLDRQATQKRRISFESYIEILKSLDLREQILVKIFYLGGHRNLEDVLSLKIENIDFEKKSVLFADGAISYPSHLFQDIKTYIQARRSGYVFLGRDGEKISHTTPFRALKTVVSKLNLDPSFTFKDFARDF